METLCRLPLVFVISMASVNLARADINLTGSWDLTYYDISVTAEAVQSGTSLTLGGWEGTIDPVTGAFSLGGAPKPGGVLPAPWPGGYPFGPSPAGTMYGRASADGNGFDATVVEWIIKTHPPVDFEHFPWFGFVYPVDGTRRNLILCAGDCDGDERVSVDELVRGVNLALGSIVVLPCPSMDRNGDGDISVDELLHSINVALDGC